MNNALNEGDGLWNSCRNVRISSTNVVYLWLFLIDFIWHWTEILHGKSFCYKIYVFILCVCVCYFQLFGIKMPPIQFLAAVEQISSTKKPHTKNSFHKLWITAWKINACNALRCLIYNNIIIKYVEISFFVDKTLIVYRNYFWSNTFSLSLSSFSKNFVFFICSKSKANSLRVCVCVTSVFTLHWLTAPFWH